ncbi:MAG TPA: response regulator [Polyangiaceae bacterium]|nr:response regulator [Polyangiaceae bacterium]
MHLSLRVKLFMIVGATALSLAIVIVSDLRLVRRQESNLEELQERLVPKLELEPRLLAQFEQLGQALKDGVAAQDRAAVEDTDQLRARIDATIEDAGAALAHEQARSLHDAVAAYHRIAINVSLRMLDGEGGEELVLAMKSMQEQQERTVALIERLTVLDKATLRAGFASLQQTSEAAARTRLSIGLVSLTLVIGLSVWLGRGALRSLARITDGFDRFARGKLDEPIVPSSADELGTLAHEANRMAAALQQLSLERDAADWIRAGQVELADKLGGDPDPARAATIALDVLARRVAAVAGALYLEDSEGAFERAATFAFSAPSDGELSPVRFQPGEGLVGQAALGSGIRVVEDVPPGYATVRSGLGEAPPCSLVFVPLRHGQRVIGLVELGLFRTCSSKTRDYLSAVSESLATTLESARSRAWLQDLLEESQTLAARLSTQEEELLSNNHELSAQQEELRVANDELEAQRATLEKRNGELEQTRSRLQEKADELAKMSSYKSQFLANMSHELRTPLNSMLLLSQLLSDNEAGNLTAKQVEHCRTIYSAGKGLLSLINQVLDLSKIEAGKQELHADPVPLVELAEQLGRTFEPQLAQKGLFFRLEIAPDVPRVILTDGQCLQRILINLLGNALKFTERGGVTLRIGRPAPQLSFARSKLVAAECVAFAVCDTGVGIPAAIQERIFGRFEQADARTVRRYGGTGLGLSIARESAQLMGGELRVESIEGTGSTFTCYLPERMPQGDTPQAAREPASSRPPRVVADDRAVLGDDEPHLLIVEDDPIFAERLVETVRSVGLRAVVAMNGRQALRLAHTRTPTGIVLDVKLPDIDGFALRAELRADPRTANVPVHFVSGLETPRGTLGLSAVGYLEKPASREAIVKAIQNLVRPEAAPSRVLVVEDDDVQAQSVVDLLAKSQLEAVEARTADEAVRALSSERFGCVILDLGLPDTDGLRLLEGLRARDDIALPPVVVHTARALSREETRLLRDYAEAVVLKEGSSSARLVDEVSTFVRQLEGQRVAPPAAPVAPAPEVDAIFGGKKVLIADDDMRTVYALSALLRDKGADVLVAETGREALRALDEHEGVGAVLMDIMMPDMDGYEAMRRVREQQRFADLPLIALTARAMQGERERCEQAGASAYITKPIDPSGLLTTLEHWFMRTPHTDTGNERVS